MKKIIRLFEIAINTEPKNIGRIDFFSFFFLILIIHGLVWGVFYPLFPYIYESHIGIPLMITGGFYFTFSFVTIILLALMMRKRLVDAGYSHWCFLWLVLPIVGYFIFFYLLCQPSAYYYLEDDIK